MYSNQTDCLDPMSSTQQPQLMRNWEVDLKILKNELDALELNHPEWLTS